jgi:hypothetical protein
MQLAQRFQPSSSSVPLRWAVVFVLVCALIAVFACTAASAADALSEKAIATTPVQVLAAKNDSYEMPEQAVFNMYEPPQPDFLANYARTADGQWHIPQQVDPTNPSVRLLILGPERPTLVDVAIYVEGQPYTAAREKLIDGLMDHATLESLVREAVNVPVPEGSEEAKSKKTDDAEESEAESSSTDEEAKDEEAKDNDDEKVVSKVDAEDSDKVQAESADEKVDEKSDKDDAKDEESSQENGDDKKEKEPEKPVVEVKRRASRSVAQRLVNYMASADVKADREEIRWLLAEWTGGPALLTLGPAMSWQRVSFAPLWNALDADADGLLSAAEISAASERLSQADVDENSIIEMEELTAMHAGSTTSPHSYPLIVVIDGETDWQQLNSHLQAAYGRRTAESQGPAPSAASAFLDRIAAGDPSVSTDDLRELITEEADLKLRVTVGAKDKENQLALLSVGDAESTANEKIVTVVRGAEYFEFSAGETKDLESTDPAATQIAIGAVADGYPLFRLVDRNGDRRLSPRECRNLKNVLAALDLDGNGDISSREQPTAIRVSITRGPHVHEMLSEPTSAARAFASSGLASTSPPPAAGAAGKVPPWFADMDRNRDGDVSRTEFLGTREQFKELDRDQDGLIGSQEAGE